MTLFSKKKKNKNRRKKGISFSVNADMKSNKKGSFRKIIFLTLFLLGIYLSFSFLNQKITDVFFEDELRRVSSDDLLAISSEIYSQGYLLIDLNQFKKKIEELNWVKNARIERKWPNQIKIFIEEEDIIGRWNEDSIINSKGNLYFLKPQSLPNDLLELYGPEGQHSLVFSTYLSFNDEMVARGILIERIELDFKGSWSLIIRPDIAIRFGKDDIEERFNRFLMIWDKSLLDNLTLIEYIDLRYTEGFSVKKRK